MSKLSKSVLIVLLVLIIDQALKVWVKTHMTIGEEIHIAGNWFILHFIENNGMAFGLEFAGKIGKVILSLFRIAAIVAIGWYIKMMHLPGSLWRFPSSLPVLLGISLTVFFMA